MAAPPMRRGPPDGWQKWHIIYPCYVDSSKKCSEGRKVSLAKCKDCEPATVCCISQGHCCSSWPAKARAHATCVSIGAKQPHEQHCVCSKRETL